ncbi:hypothetical protein [Paraburkholderia sp. BL25I1N1]|uniref:hypothetical protein n=1 Tax=Paraburkholderia sp. BL25I1N1 TaxID=1938804 RepID=UPI000D04E214|nr:hypothetical protein [Paraburkholderia sp. BL25I1N1]PRY05419.1 hypothetical protein B0G73_10915 [Paraburkholderia sp. BL25I1N1]
MRHRAHALPPMPRIVVYGLAFSDSRGALRFFFVSGLLRTPGFGVIEHVAWLRSMHPALSQHLALLESNAACAVRAVILRECDAQAECAGLPFKAQLDDNVRFETIRLTRGGHTLLNMRCGTVAERASLNADVVGVAVLCAEDLAVRRELLKKRASHTALRTSAIVLLRREWERGRHHPLNTRALCFLFSRAFPSAWRRLAQLPEIEMPATNATPAEALCLLMNQARAARVSVPANPECADRPFRRRGIAATNQIKSVSGNDSLRMESDEPTLQHEGRRNGTRRDRAVNRHLVLVKARPSSLASRP